MGKRNRLWDVYMKVKCLLNKIKIMINSICVKCGYFRVVYLVGINDRM